MPPLTHAGFACGTAANGIVVLYTDGTEPGGVACPLRLIVWNGDFVVRLLVAFGDRSHTRLILGDFTCLNKPAKEAKQPAAAAAAAAAGDGEAGNEDDGNGDDNVEAAEGDEAA